MRGDIKSNMTLAEEIPAASYSGGAENGAGVDLSDARSASFMLTAGTFGASATLDAKVQMSDNNTDWSDEDGATGNDTAITQLTAADFVALHVPNPQKRYYRVVATQAVAAVVFGVTSVIGPNRSIEV